MTGLFNPADSGNDNHQEISSYKELLVGEGKKFKDDEALAKGKYESDAFIEQLQGELSGIRQELDKRLTLEEVLSKINESKSNDSRSDPSGQIENQDHGKAALTQDEVLNLVRQTLSQEQQQAAAARNVDIVRNELSKAWGSSFPTKLKSVAGELGVSEQFLNDMAAKSPAAFLKLVNAEPTQRQPFEAPVQSSVRMQSQSNAGIKNYAHYQKLKKEDPRRYWSVEVQGEIHKAARELGDRFFS